jgi:acyl-CoA reductase-like NAD-dependent aldehyde dehydrogenase
MSMTMEDAEALIRAGRVLIGDEWLTEASAGQFIHVNPSTGRDHPPIPMSGAEEVDRAVLAARRALPSWREMPRDARRDLLLDLAALLRQSAAELAALTSVDNGSPRTLAAGGAAAVADYFTYYAGWVDKIGGEVIPTWPAPALDYTLMEPYGVVGVIIPWNVPLYNVGQVVAAALAAGNCVLFKPPELAPFAVLRFAELVLEAGIPPGVVNVVTGGPECGAAMVAHPNVDKVHFIGSGAVARQIMATAAQTLKPLTLELGGKSANLVFADADLKAAATHGALRGIGNSGQGCIIPSRLLVEDSVYDEVVEMVVEVARSIRPGKPFDPETTMGPVINAAACERILGVIERANAEGAGTLLTGGRRLGGDLADGFFIEPTVFGDVDNSSDLAQREIFGPVLSVLRFRDEEEGVRLANATEYGLAGYLFTSDLKRAHRVAAALEAGAVGINGAGVQVGAPMGGVKQSGFGTMGGRFGLEDFLRPKNVYISLA